MWFSKQLSNSQGYAIFQSTCQLIPSCILDRRTVLIAEHEDLFDLLLYCLA